MFSLDILSIQCKIRRDRLSDTQWSSCWSPVVYFSVEAAFVLVRILNILPQVLYSSVFAERQVMFVLFASYIVLLYFLLLVLQNLFILFYQLIECCRSLAISWTRLVEFVTWQRLHPWISGSSLPYNPKP